MKSVPCFLALLSFLMALSIGCHQTSSQAVKAASMTPSKKEAIAPKADKKPLGSDYEELVLNSPIALYMRGEPLKAERKLKPGETVYVCQATGAFKLAPTSDFILMEKYCLSPEALTEGFLDGFAVEDEVASRREGDKFNFYHIPFEKSVVEVEVQGGKTNVFLHYQDEGEKFHHISLPQRQGEKYAYSFDALVPEPILPENQEWTLEAEEIERYRLRSQK